MRLFYAGTSPYARKVRVVIAEKGLEPQVEAIRCNPFDDVAELMAVNPLSKVPSLELDDGAVLYDSPVIAEYIDSLGEAARLIPAEGPARWRVLRQQALGDGILDAAFSMVMERRRPDEQQSRDWLERWRAAIARGLDSLEAEIDGLGGPITLGHITLGAALGYLDFRLPDLEWRGAREKTASWFATFAERPSMIATRPDA